MSELYLDLNKKLFRVVDSLDAIPLESESKLPTEAVIYNRSEKSMLDIVLALNALNTEDVKFIYINSVPDALLDLIFSGLGGIVIEDNTLLYDEEILQYLLEEYTSSSLAKKPAIFQFDVLDKFVKELEAASSEDRVKLLSSSIWSSALDRAMQNVSKVVKTNDEAQLTLANFIDSVSDRLTALGSSLEETSSEITKLYDTIATLKKEKSQNVVSAYPTVPVPLHISNVIYIKEMGNCSYLASFLWSYVDYLRVKKNLRAKVLFVVPRSIGYIQKYDALPRLSQISASSISTTEDMYVTHEPSKEVLDKFFSMGQHVSIVFDRLYQEDIISGARVTKFYACAGFADAQRIKGVLSKNRIFFAMRGAKDSLIIPYFQAYALEGKTESAKKNMYFNNCKDHFKILDATIT